MPPAIALNLIRFTSSMKSQEIQDLVEQWARSKNFTAPYGILTGQHVSRNGRKYLSVTFGHARTLDATVEIYNENFIVLRTSRTFSKVCRSVTELQEALKHIG